VSISILPINTEDGKLTNSGWREVEWDDLLPELLSSYAWSPCVWRDGRRLETHFLYADWIALDFDDPDPECTIAAVKKKFCDQVHIIGTTKSHQKEKKDHPPCDRFRLVLKLARRCESLEDFRATMKDAVVRYNSDKICFDGARFFWRCRDIVSADLRDDLYYEDIVKAPEKKAAQQSTTFSTRGVHLKTRQLMAHGAASGERNVRCSMAASNLILCGFSDDQVYAMIYSQIPTSSDFSEREKRGIIVSAHRYIERHGWK
jgi:hypothetical protein